MIDLIPPFKMNLLTERIALEFPFSRSHGFDDSPTQGSRLVVAEGDSPDVVNVVNDSANIQVSVGQGVNSPKLLVVQPFHLS